MTRHRLPGLLLAGLVLSSAACRRSDPVTELLALERAWLHAQEHADSLGLDSVLATDFALEEGPHGRSVPRTEYIRRLTNPGVPDRLRLRDAAVRLRGDTALVTSRILCTVAAAGTAGVTYTLDTEDRWVRQAGRWQVTLRRMTPAAP